MQQVRLCVRAGRATCCSYLTATLSSLPSAIESPTVFDLVNQKCTTLPFENLANITRIAPPEPRRPRACDRRRARPRPTRTHTCTIQNRIRFKMCWRQRIPMRQFQAMHCIISSFFLPSRSLSRRWSSAPTANSSPGRLPYIYGSKIQFWRAPALKREFAPFELHRACSGGAE